MVIERVESDLREIYGGRPWLVASDTLQAATGTIARLRAYGAPRCFAIAARHGTGELPPPEDCEYRVLGLPPMPMMEAILAAEDALRALPDEVQRAVDRFDPDRKLRAIGAIFSDGRAVAGRTFWGARQPSWRALEDKTIIDALWDEAGIERVPSEVVPLQPEALAEAHRRYDGWQGGQGTVWAGDAHRGFHGGATYTCWVRTEAEAQRARQHLAGRCTHARVMPFLEGIPCSIHGLVFGATDPVLVLRPAEMLTLRRAGGATGFLYARVATFWDPPPQTRQQMRDVARRVGEHLRAKHAYRGAFTVDGICTPQGFRPTELNPRVGAALGLMIPGFPFSLLHDALVEGAPALAAERRRWAVDALERELLAMADHTRRGAIGFLTETVFPEPIHRSLSWTGSEWVETSDLSKADGELSAGAGAAGGFVQVKLVPSTAGGRLPVGPSIGPLAAAAVAYADRTLGTQIGPVEPAVDLTSR